MANEQTIRSYYDIISKHDAKKFADLFAEDGVFNDKSTGQVYRGREAIRGMIEGWYNAFSDFKLKPDKIMGSGDNFTVELTATGTHDGELSGPSGDISATGKKVTVPSCDVIQLKGDQIQSVNCYYAAAVLMSQIGSSLMGERQRPSQAEGRPTLS
ncbi:MAG: ester cyclase [Bacteriovoracaceae bacterium]|nr:ester cyclase [Bacteriovoracaceae bacterium]